MYIYIYIYIYIYSVYKYDISCVMIDNSIIILSFSILYDQTILFFVYC